jgi:hypothetical protein
MGPRPRSPEARPSASLTFAGQQGRRPDLDPMTEEIFSRGRSRKANAEPAGGGGGGWRDMNEKLARSRAALQGRAIGTQSWVNDKISDGDIEGGMSAQQSGTSIFDPVLCELAYRWFCPPGGQVLDPFAGGSVRGIVASRLGRQYFGVDLSARQIEANEAQGRALCVPDYMPQWRVGDSRELDTLVAPHQPADFIFSCPPYADLEVYSDDPRDLSTMPHAEFRVAFAAIVRKSCSLLKNDRFACFVIGDARDADGMYYGLPALTVEAFVAAGLRLYNNAVLVTAVGSLPIRVAKQFETSRKLGTTHQHVLIFVKGDPRAATAAVGPVEFGDLPFEAEGAAPATNGHAAPAAADIGGEV